MQLWTKLCTKIAAKIGTVHWCTAFIGPLLANIALNPILFWSIYKQLVAIQSKVYYCSVGLSATVAADCLHVPSVLVCLFFAGFCCFFADFFSDFSIWFFCWSFFSSRVLLACSMSNFFCFISSSCRLNGEDVSRPTCAFCALRFLGPTALLLARVKSQ